MQDRETATGKNRADTLCWVLQRTRSGFLTPSDFEGGPKIDHFLKKSTKMKKGGPKNCFKKTWFFLSICHWSSDGFWSHFWCFCSYLYHSHMQPSKPSKTIVLPMNFNDFTLQRNMNFNDFLDLFRYQFWHWFLIRFGIDFGSILEAFCHQIQCFGVIVFLMNFRIGFLSILLKNGIKRYCMRRPFSLLFRSHLYLLPP